MRILFLDIDDVLNTDRTIAAAGGYADRTTVPGVRIPSVGDPVAAQLINRACRLSQARIVISSSWLAAIGLNYAQQWLMDTGIDLVAYADPPAIDIATPDSDGKRDGILAYIRDHGIKPAAAVVVDDDEWLFQPTDGLRDRQVIVNGEDGISLENYRQILRLFQARDPDNAVF